MSFIAVDVLTAVSEGSSITEWDLNTILDTVQGCIFYNMNYTVITADEQNIDRKSHEEHMDRAAWGYYQATALFQMIFSPMSPINRVRKVSAAIQFSHNTVPLVLLIIFMQYLLGWWRFNA